MASGLGGLIGVGRTQKQQALSGLTKAAQLETQQDVASMQLEAQKNAAQMSAIGTVGGIAGANLIPKALAKRAALKAGTSAAAGAAGVAGATAAAGGAAAGTAAAGGAAAGAAGGAGAALLAAAPWAALIIGGGYLLKKLFD